MATGKSITLDEAKKYIKLEYSEDDELVDSLIVVAQEMIESFLRKPIDKNACPERVRLAMKLLVSHFYDNRETETNRELPANVYHLLVNLRDPRW